MNILAVCHYGLYQDLSSSFVHNQIREYVRLGHRVRVIVPIAYGKMLDGMRVGNALAVKIADGVEICYLRYFTLSSFGERGFNTYSAICSLRTRLKSILDGFAPDVIHAHTLGFDSSIGAWLKERLNCPMVVTTHGGDTVRPLAKGLRKELKLWCDQADGVVAVSSALKTKLCSCDTETPVYSILNGFVPVESKGEGARSPLGIIQAGHLIPSKRTNITIRAFSQLKKKYPEATLTIIGQGSERASLEELCSELGVSEDVRFLGQIPNKDVLKEMSEAQFFVMVSSPEGFGIVYLEAMYSGCVAIGAEGEGISDVITSGENGFLVPIDDPEAIVRVLEECINDPDMASSVAQQGYISAKGLTWAENARQYIDLFNVLVSNN